MKIFSMAIILIIFNVFHTESVIRKCFPIRMLNENSTASSTLNTTPVQSTAQTHSSTSQSNTKSTTQSLTTSSTQTPSSQTTTKSTSSVQSSTAGSSSQTNTTTLAQSNSESTTTTQTITENSSQVTFSDASTTATTNPTSFNYSEAINNINDTDLQIATQLDYWQGNETLVNQTIKNLNALIFNLTSDPSTPEVVNTTLQNLSEIINNSSTSNKGARKKRSYAGFVSYKSVAYLASMTAFYVGIQASMTSTMAAMDLDIVDVNIKLGASQSSVNSQINDHPNITSLANVSSNINNLRHHLSNIVAAHNTIISLGKQQTRNLDALISNANQCGTFTSYDPIVNPNAPVNKSFSAGTYLDGTEAYVGVTNMTNWSFDSYIPGRCTTSGNLQGPGVYVVSNGTEMHETNRTAYLQIHNLLEWLTIDKINASTIPNAIEIKSAIGTKGYLIGRYNLTSANSTQYTQVGKVYIDNNSSNLWYADANQEGQLVETSFEVLTCVSLPSGIENLIQKYNEIKANITTSTVSSTQSTSQSTTTTQTITESSSQATTDTSTISAIVPILFNYTEAIENIFELDSQVSVQLDYLQGNQTLANQTIGNLNALISNITSDSSTPEAVNATLQNLSEAINNVSTTNAGARKKRSIIGSHLSTASNEMAVCMNNANIGLILDVNDIVNAFVTARVNIYTGNMNELARTYPNISLLVNITSHLTNLNNYLTNIAITQKAINNLSTQQQTNYDALFSNYDLCDTFISYDPIVNPNAPVGKAFSAGKYLDGTQSYVGRASLEFPNTLIPGRCTTSGNLQGPGVYVELHGEQHMTSTTTYLKDNFALTWVVADVNNASTIPNTIKIKGEGDSNGYLVGRYNLTNSNSTDYTQVAKVHIDNGFNNLWYADTNQNGQPANTAFEVLTCKPLQTILYSSPITNKTLTGRKSTLETCIENALNTSL